MKPIRVLIVDEHAMVRRGLAAVLRTAADLDLVGEAQDGEEAVRICEQIQPDVVLMDLLMPVMDGTTSTRIIRKRFPQVQVVALTSFGERELVREVLRAGAISYLLKNVSADELTGAIRAAHAGRSTLAPEAVEALASTPSQAEPEPGLTPLERKILSLMLQDLTGPAIAGQLGIGSAAVDAHERDILAKLGASDRGEAIALALRRKL